MLTLVEKLRASCNQKITQFIMYDPSSLTLYLSIRILLDSRLVNWNSPLSCTDISYFTFHLFNDEFHVQFTVLLSLVLCFPWLEDCPHFLFPRCYRRRLLTHLKPHLGNFRSINPRIFPCVPPRCQRFQFPNALLKHTHEKVGMFISSAFSNCLLPIRRDKYSAKNRL